MSGIASALRAEAHDEELAGLLRACAAGDRAALHAIYDRESAHMFGVARGILRRRDLAEDVVQDTFMQIWTCAAGFDPMLCTARTWIFTALRHRSLHLLHHGAREVAAPDGALLERAGGGLDPEAILVRLDESNRLRRCLDGLGPDRSQAILLAHAVGLSHGEIAGRMGRPLGTVKAWLRRSMLALRAGLQ